MPGLREVAVRAGSFTGLAGFYHEVRRSPALVTGLERRRVDELADARDAPAVTIAARAGARRIYNGEMASAFAARLADLPANERAEIEKLLAEHPGDRWDDDAGDGLLLPVVVLVAALGGVGAGLYELMYGGSLAGFLQTDIGTGFVVAVIAAVLLIRWLLAVRGRFGWLVTSFALVRIRGQQLRLARWSDIVTVEHTMVGRGTDRFVSLAITTPQGTLTCHSGRLLSELRKHLPPSVQVVEKK